MAEPHLKPRQYYSDLYDRHTVEECRWWESHAPTIDELKKRKGAEKLDEKELIRTSGAFNRVLMYFIKGERYVKKEAALKEWMQRDEKRDALFETAEPPSDITCLACGRLMFVSSKHFDLGWDKPDRVMFMYDCPLNHVPRRAFYNTGEEFKREIPVCPKCRGSVEENSKRKGKKITTTRTCTQCGNVETDELDLSVKKPAKEIIDPNFDRDRQRFCLSEKEGAEFIQGKENLERMGKLMDEIKEKEKNKDLYDKVKELKKLKITELEEMLAAILEKAGYIKLSFKTPEITKDVVVPFIVYDQRSDREGRASTYELEKLLRKSLVDTNWRLMTDGTSYRLGMLEGRLHGYEREEDLLGLVKTQEKKVSKNRIVQNKDGEDIVL